MILAILDDCDGEGFLCLASLDRSGSFIARDMGVEEGHALA